MKIPITGFPVPVIQTLLDLAIDQDIEIIQTRQVVVGLPEFPEETPFVAVYSIHTGFVWIETPDKDMLHVVKPIPPKHLVFKGIQGKWAVAYAHEEDIEWLSNQFSNVA